MSTPTIRHSSATEAKAVIIAALGDVADDFDIDAIFDETYAWRVEVDENGNELVTTGGFEQVVDADEFWRITQRHDVSIYGVAAGFTYADTAGGDFDAAITEELVARFTPPNPDADDLQEAREEARAELAMEWVEVANDVLAARYPRVIFCDPGSQEWNAVTVGQRIPVVAEGLIDYESVNAAGPDDLRDELERGSLVYTRLGARPAMR